MFTNLFFSFLPFVLCLLFFVSPFLFLFFRVFCKKNKKKVLHRIGGYEPERGVGVAGHRAYFLRDAGLLLNQALINYSIAFLRKR